MTSIDYIGFDIHKKTISFCTKADGRIEVTARGAGGAMVLRFALARSRRQEIPVPPIRVTPTHSAQSYENVIRSGRRLQGANQNSIPCPGHGSSEERVARRAVRVCAF